MRQARSSDPNEWRAWSGAAARGLTLVDLRAHYQARLFAQAATLRADQGAFAAEEVAGGIRDAVQVSPRSRTQAGSACLRRLSRFVRGTFA